MLKPISRYFSFTKAAHLLKIMYKNEHFAGPTCLAIRKSLLGKFHCTWNHRMLGFGKDFI